MASERKKTFIKNIFFSYTDTILTLLVSFAYTYIIANFLGPEKYGLVTFYVSFITGLLGLFGVNAIQGALIAFTPKGGSKALLSRLIRIEFYISFILFFLVMLFADEITNIFDKEYPQLLMLISLLLLISPLYDSFVYFFQGHRMFGKIVKVNYVTNIFNLLLAAGLIISLKLDMYGVIYAKISSLILGCLIYYNYTKGLPSKDTLNFKKVKKYIFDNLPLSISRRLNDQLVIFFMGLYISPLFLGFYYLAQKVVIYTIGTLTTSVTNVLTPTSSEIYKDRQLLGRYISLTTKFLLTLSFIAAIGLLLISDYVLAQFFPKFIGANKFIPLIAVYYILSSFLVLHSIYIAINRVDLILRSGIASLIITLLTAPVLMPVYGVNGAILTQILSYLVYIIMMIWSIKKTGILISLSIGKSDVIYFKTTVLEVFKKLLRRGKSYENLLLRLLR